MNFRRIFALSVLVTPALAAACGGEGPLPATPPSPTASAAASAPGTGAPVAATPPPPAPALKGLTADDEAALDRSVSPCEDFFQFACGSWVKKTSIPDDESSWMRSFSTIRDQNEATLRDIVESLGKPEAKLAEEPAQLRDFYASCMDEATIEKLGAKPLDADLKLIATVKDAASLGKVLGKLHARGMAPLFAVGVQQDFADSTKMIGAFDQAGLGMPERDYYLKTDGKFPDLRKKYEAHVTAMFTLLGNKKAAEAAATVLRIEKMLAEKQMTKEDRREPKKVYHLTARADLAKVAADFPWDAYLAELPAKDAKLFNVAQPDYLQAVGTFAKSGIPFGDWQVYLQWHVLRGVAPALSKAFVDEGFRWQSALRGTAKIPPRWKRCVRATDGALGEALAQPFVMKTLGAEGKATVKDMVLAIEEEMKKNLTGLSWMDPKTRELAQKKLAKIANKIAFPDKWRSYKGLKVDKKSYYDNVIRADAFEQARQLAKVGKPVDRNEWYMTPPTVNAYYDPSMNEMVFPAGILQPPFYANARPVAANFGGIGMVMGHELTHGFDDEGRQFDADGNLKDWWSPSVNTEFEKRASCVEKQYDEYVVLDTHVNGKLTLGENLADLGGVKLALAALKQKVGKTEAAEGAATPEQQFFLGFAQGWCGKYRDEMMRLLVATNPHSPPNLRVNGPLSNTPEFAAAFSCKPGHKMVRTQRCEVW